ncbi:MAG: hypothetical protein IIB66_06050, partial [Proteobacteria bacterium]|nr:hypothetical protein [Pseudomonadota bacterium]
MGSALECDCGIEAMSETRTFFGRRKKAEQQDAAGKRLQRLIADDVVRVIEEGEPPQPESKDGAKAETNGFPGRAAQF